MFMYSLCVPWYLRKPERMWDPQEPELQTVGSHHVGARNLHPLQEQTVQN